MKRLLACAGLLGVFVTATAMATITVRKTFIGGGTSDMSPAPNPGDPFDVHVSNSVRDVRIWSSLPATEDIGRVTIRADDSATNVIMVLLTDPLGSLSTLPQPPACKDWGGLDNSRRNIQFVGSVLGNVTGGVVGRISALDAAGAIQGAIWNGVDSSDVGGPCFIRAGSISATGEVRARAGNISLVSTTGSMLGDIIAESDLKTIGMVSVGGDIGSPSRTSVIDAKDGINTVSAASVWALVDPQSGVFPTTKTVSIGLHR